MKRGGESERVCRICPKRKRKRGEKRVKRLKPGRLGKLEWEVRKGEVVLRDVVCQAHAISRYVYPPHGATPPTEWFDGPCEGPLDVDHIVKRSKGGTDDLSNLRLLCRRHHERRHPEKQTQWSRKTA